MSDYCHICGWTIYAEPKCECHEEMQALRAKLQAAEARITKQTNQIIRLNAERAQLESESRQMNELLWACSNDPCHIPIQRIRAHLETKLPKYEIQGDEAMSNPRKSARGLVAIHREQLDHLRAENARLRGTLEQIIRKSTEVNEWALANIARAALEVKHAE